MLLVVPWIDAARDRMARLHRRNPDAESFEFAGRMGYALMALPLGPIRPLFELYRKAWREAGHPGQGEGEEGSQ